jgi:hypothetical protein
MTLLMPQLLKSSFPLELNPQHPVWRNGWINDQGILHKWKSRFFCFRYSFRPHEVGNKKFMQDMWWMKFSLEMQCGCPSSLPILHFHPNHSLGNKSTLG